MSLPILENNKCLNLTKQPHQCLGLSLLPDQPRHSKRRSKIVAVESVGGESPLCSGGDYHTLPFFLQQEMAKGKTLDGAGVRRSYSRNDESILSWSCEEKNPGCEAGCSPWRSSASLLDLSCGSALSYLLNCSPLRTTTSHMPGGESHGQRLGAETMNCGLWSPISCIQIPVLSQTAYIWASY